MGDLVHKTTVRECVHDSNLQLDINAVSFYAYASVHACSILTA